MLHRSSAPPSLGQSVLAPTPAPAATSAVGGAGPVSGATVTTGRGSGRDQYGRAFGPKQAAALRAFTRESWLTDSVESLRRLLTHDVAQRKFAAYLRSQYLDASLDFYLEVGGTRPPERL